MGEPGSSPKRAPATRCTKETATVIATPQAMPASATHRKVTEAEASEKAPVMAAATAKRKHTRPLASLSRDSPSRMCIRRCGTWMRAVMAETATGSVGATMAARAKATGSGIAGTSQWIRKQAPTTVKTTRPRASSRMVPLSRNSPIFGMRQPSRNSSGGRNSRKKISGSRVTPWPNTPEMTAPSPICTSGSGTPKGSMRTR